MEALEGSSLWCVGKICYHGEIRPEDRATLENASAAARADGGAGLHVQPLSKEPVIQRPRAADRRGLGDRSGLPTRNNEEHSWGVDELESTLLDSLWCSSLHKELGRTLPEESLTVFGIGLWPTKIHRGHSALRECNWAIGRFWILAHWQVRRPIFAATRIAVEIQEECDRTFRPYVHCIQSFHESLPWCYQTVV